MPIELNGVTFPNGGNAFFNGDELSSIQVSINGDPPVEVWRRSVTLTNLVGGSSIRDNRVIDAGYNDMTYTVKTITAEAGHKYYVRARASAVGSWTMGPTSTISFDGTTVTSSGGNQTTGAIMKSPSAGSRSVTHRVYGSSAAGAYSACDSYTDMIVDITPLEEAAGRTFDAAQFWSYIGSTVFYGSKEFIP